MSLSDLHWDLWWHKIFNAIYFSDDDDDDNTHGSWHKIGTSLWAICKWTIILLVDIVSVMEKHLTGNGKGNIHVRGIYCEKRTARRSPKTWWLFWYLRIFQVKLSNICIVKSLVFSWASTNPWLEKREYYKRKKMEWVQSMYEFMLH